ncbi:sigma-54-dependent transcriptional regulator [Pseudoalteromonas luteoviolacea]|uniref:sigma-54-dependent transcriptional regulator n=1 Tax=Pseudoalteromonas luteoviolacea TaxID=43657 RepID=UPI00115081B8|nr:sigma-54 dependent transcriptional regulator [Pseudoalteromonas luteoviolacea]TQF72627.1 sigma-54-dependent Fis family transcriptional regulator [Pseudoalteromonas luteoviolacea]
MEKQGTILIVDDNTDVLLAAKLLLKQHHKKILTTDNPFDVEGLLNIHQVDVILLDMNFNRDAISGQEGFYWLKKIHTQVPSIAVVLMTAYSDVKLAVEAIKNGATDFVAKPWQNDQLLTVIATALAHAQDKQAINQLSRQTQGLSQALSQPQSEFLGQSDAMLQVFDTLNKAAKTDANILITGESGTGKELTAHAIHAQSTRAHMPFISLDMGAVSGSLFESELFGHKKGAFTDAKMDRVGRFELAHGGTLFLDEVGNMPLDQQVKLLAAIQNRQITPVGGNQTIDVDIRLVCATNDALPQSVVDGQFRQDLLYRINTIEINLPPLRERKEDIPLLVDHYMNIYQQKYRRELALPPSALSTLCEYSWPGNVRELAHTIERAVILSEGSELAIHHVLIAPNTPASAQSNSLLEYDTFDLDVLEQRAIRAALKHHQGNVSHAAKALGLTRGAMYRRLEKYGL